MIERFAVFFSAAFSGGYKIFAVLLITILFSESTVKEFNTLYFIVLMCVSLGVIPLASMMTASSFSLSGSAKLLWLLTSSLLACSIISLFQAKLAVEIDFFLFLVLLVAVLFVGGYELARRELANRSMFKQVFVGGMMSTLLFLLVFVAAYFEYSSPELLILLLSVCFGLPVFGGLLLKQDGASVFGGLKVSLFFSRYGSAFLSNSSSSLVSYVLPLVMVSLLQSAISPYLAVIFSAANLCMLVPRYMAEKNIPLMRNGGEQTKIAGKTFYITSVYLVFVSIISLAVFYLLDMPDFLLYFLLFFSLQLTQLTLPYANVLMVAGQFSLLLKSNLLSLLPFILLLVLFQFSLTELQLSYSMILLYIISSLVKLILTRKYCQPIFNKRESYVSLSGR